MIRDVLILTEEATADGAEAMELELQRYFDRQYALAEFAADGGMLFALLIQFHEETYEPGFGEGR